MELLAESLAVNIATSLNNPPRLHLRYEVKTTKNLFRPVWWFLKISAMLYRSAREPYREGETNTG